MNNRQIKTTLEFFVDGITLILSLTISFLIVKLINKLPVCDIYDILGFALISLVNFCFVFFCFYKPLDTTQRNRVTEIFNILINNSFYVAGMAFMLILTKNAFRESRYLLVSTYAINVLLNCISRYFLKKQFFRIYSNSKYTTKVAVLCDFESSQDFLNEFSNSVASSVKGLFIFNAVEDENGEYTVAEESSLSFSENGVAVAVKRGIKEVCGYKIEGNENSIINWARKEPVDSVYIISPNNQSLNTQLINDLESMGITVNVNISSLENIIKETDYKHLNCTMSYGHPMATFSPSVQDYQKLVVKRTFDIFVSFFACLLSLPIILIVAIPLKLESKGPLFFKQDRVGKNGRVFKMYKLRSMYNDAEKRKAELMKSNQMQGLMFKIDNDPRITKVGKFIRKTSIDELPQFFNVLKGDMSLVGTRPPTVDEFEQYENHHKRRLSMRPGITGMWQTSGRSNIKNFEEIVELDLQYIDNWSFGLDIKLLLKTVLVVLRKDGAE